MIFGIKPMWRKKDIIRVYKEGEVIVKEGDPGREMFIIQSGSVEISKEFDSENITLATLVRGDFFGEMALVENMPRIATATARETTKVLVLNIGTFMIKIRKDPAFAYNIMQRLSHRLRVTTESMSELIKDVGLSEERFISTQSEYLMKYFKKP